MLLVGVTIEQIENKHLHNLLIFRVLIILGAQKKFWEALPPNIPRGYGPGYTIIMSYVYISALFLKWPFFWQCVSLL